MSELESFVSAEVAASFLSIEPRQLLRMARTGEIPAYGLGLGAKHTRHVWRFKLSELADAMRTRVNFESPSVPQSKGVQIQ